MHFDRNNVTKALKDKEKVEFSKLLMEKLHQGFTYGGVPSGYAAYSVNTLGYQKNIFEKAYSLEA